MASLEINGKFFKNVPNNESDVWKVIGKELSEADCPSTVKVTVSNTYHGVFKVSKRGTWTDDNGTVFPSRYITLEQGNLDRMYPSSKYDSVYMTCIHPKSNNYKAYYMEQKSDGTITARYESIDKFLKGEYREVKDPYPSYMFWVRYYEKISKGYVDQSDIYFSKSTKTQNTTSKATPKTASEVLYKLLYDYAYHKVETTLVSVHVTEKQVKTARRIWKKLGTYKTLRAFNKHLQELLVISPRKRNPLQDDVADFLAKDKSEMADIVDREDDLITAMETLLGGNKTTSKANTAPSFKKFGVEVFEANSTQRQEVLNLLGTSNLVNKIGRIWRVKPLKQEKRFAEYCKKRHIRQIRKFWHGSRNENWASIIENSLSLSPNAIITGKMFGDGIYFAPSPSKSFNYTSYKGTSWANGKSDRGFMGIFATAYGNPNMVSTWGGDYSADCKRGQYDCVHATSGNTGLRADEVVFYDENAMCLNYLVEFC